MHIYIMLSRSIIRECAEDFLATNAHFASLALQEHDGASNKFIISTSCTVEMRPNVLLYTVDSRSTMRKLELKSSCNNLVENSTLMICTLILSLLLTLQVTAVVAAASAGCSSQKCGNVTVSYPFGIKGAGCGLPGFQLNCSTNSSSLSSNLTLSTVTGSYQVTAVDASYLVLDATPLKAWADTSVNISFQVANTSPYLIDTSNVLFGYGASTTAQFSTDRDGGTHPSCQNLAVNQYTTTYCDYYACCSATNVPPGVRTVNMSASEGAGSTARGYASIIFPETYSTPTAKHFAGGSWGMKLGWYLRGNCSADGNSTCSENSTCSDTSGAGFRCACLQGWQGDGYRNGTGCIDVNECNNATLNTCSSPYATCINTVGNYTCSCPAGFTGNGYAVGTQSNATGCTDINECAILSLNSCAPNATCTNTPGAYNCSCNAGFKGDGFVNGSRCTASATPTPNSVTDNNVAIAGVAGTSFVTIVVGILITICCVQRRRKVKRFARRNLEALGNMKDFFSSSHGKTATLYSLRELEKATRNFAAERILGEGGFGTVYKGTLDNGVEVAIKKTNHVDTSGSQQFVNEVSILSQVNHRNLVRLHGCCLETEVPMLVYEYVPNGNLLEHLQGQRSELHLGWEKRLQIAVETAEALGYLHSAAYPPIYHRDVKTSNILLDDKYVVKVSDFGISRLVKPDATHVSTAVQGTPGYLDPEYFHSYQLTEKSDVYSFGVVLLELITSLKPLDFERDSKDINLTAMVLPFVRMGNVEAIVDPKLVDKDESNFTQMLQEIQGVAELASRCLAHQRHDRPSMKEVVGELLAIKGVPQRASGWSDIDSFEPGELEMLPILDGFDTNSTAYTNSSCTSSNDPLVISRNIKLMDRDVNAR